MLSFVKKTLGLVAAASLALSTGRAGGRLDVQQLFGSFLGMRGASPLSSARMSDSGGHAEAFRLANASRPPAPNPSPPPPRVS